MFVPKLQISISGTAIWTRRKFGSTRPPNTGGMAKEDFHSVEPAPSSGFRRIKSLHSATTRKLKSALVVAGHPLTPGYFTTHFITLIEPGIIRAYDLVKHQVTDEIKLPNDVCEGLSEYTEMDAFDERGKLLIIGVDKAKNTKVILVMDYPPWKKMGIIRVQLETPVRISVSQGVCFFLVNKKWLHITTFAYLMRKVKQVTPLTPANAAIDGYPTVAFEGTLNEFPEILSKVQIDNEYFGLMETNSVPMFFGRVKTGVKMFTFEEKPLSVYEFVTDQGDEEEPIEVFPFADGSSKALFCTHTTAKSKLVEFASEWKNADERKVLGFTTLDSFNYWEKKKELKVQSSSSSTSSRPKRSCVNNNIATYMESKVAILGLQFCPAMHLIAVLTADDEDFHVVIYEPLKLEAVKALPPVHAWPKARGSDDVNKLRESIVGVDFAFEADYIFVTFLYNSDQKEAFILRLFAEKLD